MKDDEIQLIDWVESSNSFQKQALDTIAENEALKAQVNAMRGKLDWISGFMVENTEYKVFQKLFEWGKSTDNILASTPEQCLNSVKADAINHIIEEFTAFSSNNEAILYVEDVKLYVDKLRD